MRTASLRPRLIAAALAAAAVPGLIAVVPAGTAAADRLAGTDFWRRDD